MILVRDNENFKFTHHGRKRLFERFHICKKQDIRKIFAETSEPKYVFNKHEFMVRMYEKHGYDNKYRFLVDEEKDILFLVINMTIITCFSYSNSAGFNRFVEKGFGKRKQKRVDRSKREKIRKKKRRWKW